MYSLVVNSLSNCTYIIEEIPLLQQRSANFPQNYRRIINTCLTPYTLLNGVIQSHYLLHFHQVETSIPTPKRELEKPFLMPVEDTFSISGRGTVATGRIEQGCLKTGDELEIVGLKATQKTICTGE